MTDAVVLNDDEIERGWGYHYNSFRESKSWHWPSRMAWAAEGVMRRCQDEFWTSMVRTYGPQHDTEASWEEIEPSASDDLRQKKADLDLATVMWARLNHPRSSLARSATRGGCDCARLPIPAIMMHARGGDTWQG